MFASAGSSVESERGFAADVALHLVYLSALSAKHCCAVSMLAGSSVESERGFAADVVLHLVYLAGLFTFAVVLGIVTDDISTQVDKVR
jgi:hypothetical protein